MLGIQCRGKWQCITLLAFLLQIVKKQHQLELAPSYHHLHLRLCNHTILSFIFWFSCRCFTLVNYLEGRWLSIDILFIWFCILVILIYSYFDSFVHYISRGSPLFWIGVGVGFSALFSVVRIIIKLSFPYTVLIFSSFLFIYVQYIKGYFIFFDR